MIRIMPAQPPDLAALYELIDHSELPRAGLAEHLNSALIARKGDQLVGSVAVECYGDAGLLRSVAVDSAYRGQGVGAELIAAAFDLARRQGITTIYLLTTSAPDYFPRFHRAYGSRGRGTAICRIYQGLPGQRDRHAGGGSD